MFQTDYHAPRRQQHQMTYNNIAIQCSTNKTQTNLHQTTTVNCSHYSRTIDISWYRIHQKKTPLSYLLL